MQSDFCIVLVELYCFLFSLLTCKRPFAGGHMLFREALVFAGLCGKFNLWKLFVQLLHEYLQRETISDIRIH